MRSVCRGRGSPSGLVVALAIAAAVSLAGCVAGGGPYWPYPGPAETRRPSPPPPPPAVSRAPAPIEEERLASVARSDQEGLGSGPLGRTNVVLDRAIAAAERAGRRGERVDPALLAHLRMTRQARDLIATGDRQRAADLLERAIAIDDGAGFAYIYLGFLHLQAGRPEQAEAFLDRAENLVPQDPALLREIASLRARAGGGVGRVPVAGSP